MFKNIIAIVQNLKIIFIIEELVVKEASFRDVRNMTKLPVAIFKVRYNISKTILKN